MSYHLTFNIPMPSWVQPRSPEWSYVGWFPTGGTFEEHLEKAQRSERGELREVDIYEEGAAVWVKSNPV